MNPLKSVGYKGAVIRYCQRQGLFSLDADGFEEDQIISFQAGMLSRVKRGSVTIITGPWV